MLWRRLQTRRVRTLATLHLSCLILTHMILTFFRIDTSHFPVFHQMEGLRIFSDQDFENLRASLKMPDATEEQIVIQDLKNALEGMVDRLFGKVEKRWVDAYFPFTNPSLEFEIYYNGKWMEVLGCGMIQQAILTTAGHSTRKGWAFGLGLERLAMVLFDISDIRLFWSRDGRFLDQFESGKIVKFKPFSRMPACYKDISFWVPSKFHENDFFEIVRSIAGDVVEDVKLVDKFTHPKRKQDSYCFRINYRHMERTLRNEEVDAMQERVKSTVVSDLKVELR
jgi:phenylalanyl-tRNA synthetase alpha chain